MLNCLLARLITAVMAFQRLEDLEKTRVELQNAKRQCELVKSLLADASAEKDIMYEVSGYGLYSSILLMNVQAFNEELDGMYNDANLPESEAWTAMTTDLRRTKEARNALTKTNSYANLCSYTYGLRLTCKWTGN